MRIYASWEVGRGQPAQIKYWNKWQSYITKPSIWASWGEGKTELDRIGSCTKTPQEKSGFRTGYYTGKMLDTGLWTQFFLWVWHGFQHSFSLGITFLIHKWEWFYNSQGSCSLTKMLGGHQTLTFPCEVCSQLQGGLHWEGHLFHITDSQSRVLGPHSYWDRVNASP